jgi:hypothetical protein
MVWGHIEVVAATKGIVKKKINAGHNQSVAGD